MFRFNGWICLRIVVCHFLCGQKTDRHTEETDEKQSLFRYAPCRGWRTASNEDQWWIDDEDRWLWGYCRKTNVSTVINNQIIIATQGVTRNLFPGFFFRPFRPSPSLPFPSLCPLSPPPRSGPSNPAKRFGGALLAPPAGENDICRQQTRSLDFKYIKNAGARLQTHYWCI